MSALPITVAETHRAEYRFHKYWARKPANVLRAHLSSLLPTSGVVIDPFCGSGVLLKEAAALGHEVYGCDINPVAARLSRFTLDPPPLDAFLLAAQELLDTVSRPIAAAFAGSNPTAAPIRYVVHAVVVTCPACGLRVSADQAVRDGRRYRCPGCAARLRFNGRTMTGTDVIEVVDEHGATREPTRIRAQRCLADRAVPGVDPTAYDAAFVENRRTLTHAGMRVSDLYTPRAFSAVALVAQRIDAVTDPGVREALQLVLTSASAQSSRLIAYRAGMTGGGPAWTVPGYWIPPIHLESNPLAHLRARLRKFESAIPPLRRRSRRGHSERIECQDATRLLERLRAEGKRADLVFLDPPYGDSVPYLEFSTLWNAFLKASPPLSGDMSVSDRKRDQAGWARYRAKMAEVVRASRDVLSSRGVLLITFNSHDPRAWSSLVSALRAGGFWCREVAYQIPAVVSSKAQFSLAGSYVGDIYSVYTRAEHPVPGFEQVRTMVRAALRRCASTRGGVIARNLARRTAMIELMRVNAGPEALESVDRWLAHWFDPTADGLRWKELPSGLR